MEVSGHLHAPAALLQGRNIKYADPKNENLTELFVIYMQKELRSWQNEIFATL
jgi:hypothetical protein